MKFLFCIPILIFLTLSVLQWNSPPIEDERLIHQGALIWHDKGADWFELAHTPLYLESLSFWQKIWGRADTIDQIFILRSFGTFTSLLTILFFLYGLYFREKKLKLQYLIALSALVLHPFFTQYSLLLDYDTTVVIPTLLLFVVLVEYWDKQESPTLLHTFILSIVLALALMAKELTSLLPIVLWPLWSILRQWRASDKKWIKHTIHAILGSISALFLFFILLNLWGFYRGFHWYDPLLLTFDKILRRSPDKQFFPWSQWGLSKFIFLSYIPLLWIGFPTFYVFFKSIRQKFLENIKCSSKFLNIFCIAKVPFSLLLSICILFAYTWIVQASFYFPKYTAPAWCLFVYGIAQFIDSSEFKIQKKYFILFGVLIIFGLLPILDPLQIIENRSFSEPIVLIQHFFAVTLPLLFFWILAKNAQPLFPFLLIYFLSTNAGHVISNHNTRYLYGEYGFKQTLNIIKDLKRKISPNTPILSAARDLHWALGKDAEFLSVLDLREHEQTLALTSKVLVSRTYGADAVTTNPKLKQIIESTYHCHHTIDLPGNRFEWWWNPEQNLNSSNQCE